MTREHSLHVAVEDRMARTAGQREDRARGGTTDAGQIHHRVERRRKDAAVLISYALGRALQVARAGVIAETGPQVQYFVRGRVGERPYVGEALHEAFEIGD